MATYADRVVLHGQLHRPTPHRSHGMLFELLPHVRLDVLDLPRLLLSVEDQVSRVRVLDVAVELGPKGHADVRSRPLHFRAGEAEHGHAPGDPLHHGPGHLVVAAHHAVQGTVRFDVVEWDALTVQEPLQRAHLIHGHGRELFRGQLHLAAAEALQVGEAWMGAALDVVLLACLDRLGHDERVTAAVEYVSRVVDLYQNTDEGGGNYGIVAVFTHGSHRLYLQYRSRVGSPDQDHSSSCHTAGHISDQRGDSRRCEQLTASPMSTLSSALCFVVDVIMLEATVFVSLVNMLGAAADDGIILDRNQSI